MLDQHGNEVEVVRVTPGTEYIDAPNNAAPIITNPDYHQQHVQHQPQPRDSRIAGTKRPYTEERHYEQHGIRAKREPSPEHFYEQAGPSTRPVNQGLNRFREFEQHHYADSDGGTGHDSPREVSAHHPRYIDKQQKEGEIAAFIHKIEAMINSASANPNMRTKESDWPLIMWNEEGTSFLIRDPQRFTDLVIPEHFRHRNRASFIRQLNQYGFKKKNRMDHDTLSAAHRRDDLLEYHHEYFLRDRKDLWWKIKRAKAEMDRKKEKEIEEMARQNEEVMRQQELRSLTDEVRKFREEQDAMQKELEIVKSQNEKLVTSNNELFQRDKYNKHCLKKLCSLLVSHFRPNENGHSGAHEIMGLHQIMMQPSLPSGAIEQESRLPISNGPMTRSRSKQPVIEWQDSQFLPAGVPEAPVYSMPYHEYHTASTDPPKITEL